MVMWMCMMRCGCEYEWGCECDRVCGWWDMDVDMYGGMLISMVRCVCL